MLMQSLKDSGDEGGNRFFLTSTTQLKEMKWFQLGIETTLLPIRPKLMSNAEANKDLNFALRRV